MEEAEAVQHYEQWGYNEGRHSSPACWRENFVKDIIEREEGPILEIGPFCNPILSGPMVSYLDVLDASELRYRAEGLGIDTLQCPDKIDFVGDLGSVDATFDAVVSCHSIEHQPDLVRHLRDVADVLEVGGRYYVIAPDKRFCFDALQPESTIANVLQAHREKRTRHLLQSVIEHRALTVHNDPVRHWNGDHGELTLDGIHLRTVEAMKEFDNNDGYIDVHAWYFTPRNFESICEILFRSGMTSLRPAAVYPTPRGSIEFCAVLEKA
jgi:SAM-dependent methyltransferase